MTKSTNAAARLAAVTADQPAHQPAPPAVRTAPVKMTVEVDHGFYDYVRTFADAHGVPARVGKVRIPTVEVFRALIMELQDDPDLADRVAQRIVDNVG